MAHKMSKAEARSAVVRQASHVMRTFPIRTDEPFFDLQASHIIPTNYIPLVAFANRKSELALVMAEFLRASFEEQPTTGAIFCPQSSNLSSVLEWLRDTAPEIEVACGEPKAGVSYTLVLYDVGDGKITAEARRVLCARGAKVGKIVAMSDRAFPGGREAAKEATECEPIVAMPISELFQMGKYYHELGILPQGVMALRSLDKLNISYAPLYQTPDWVLEMMPRVDPSKEPFPVVYPDD